MRIACLLLAVAAACGGTESETLTVTGDIRTHVTSEPAGIDCGSGGATCVADFDHGSHVMLVYTNPVDNTGLCPIDGCAATPAEAVVQPGCKEVVMVGPVTARFQCVAP